MPDLENDPRLDPRVKWALRNVPVTNLTDVDSRETLLEISNHPKAVAMREKGAALYDALDTEEVASSAGLSIAVHEFTSAPDANTVKIRYVRPEGDDVVPCVYYIHGGGMQNGSAFDALYRIWARVLAAEGLAVAMVDFRMRSQHRRHPRSNRSPPDCTTASRACDGSWTMPRHCTSTLHS